ncbi:MAG TPA: sulfotransferase [Candidatus Acidoferrales bacterium]|nr:sulfotransferase [Candidatus Acidoferrales bacterium]
MSKDLEAAYGANRHIARWQKAQQHLVNGRPELALGIYQELLKSFPDTARLWFELGFAAGKELNFALAEAAGQRVLELASKNAQLLVLLGQQYHWLRQPDRARACFEQAVAASPRSIHAQLTLADWYQRERRLDDAWRCVEACLALEPRNAQVLCVQALLLHRRGRNTEAETLLRDLIQAGSLDANVNYSSRHQLAAVLDQQGRHAEAICCLHEAKALLRRTTDVPKLEHEYDRAVRCRRELLAALTPEIIRHWREETPASPNPQALALLGGHPRTGTTLLEQILGAHPGVAAFDEPMAFPDEVADKLAPISNPAALTLQALNGLAPAQLAHFRQRYFKSLLREPAAGQQRHLLLDKNPSPTAWLPVWLRLFPELKVIIALRDPRDVIVSCYFQNLQVNATNVNFLSLERTARHYADLMDVWLRMRELGGFDWIETRYEEMVFNLAGEGRRATEFLGLAWYPEQEAFHTASRQKFIFSPNYTDAAKPVYRRSVGRWKNYEEALRPLQAKLAPYCQAFGYSQ